MFRLTSSSRHGTPGIGPPTERIRSGYFDDHGRPHFHVRHASGGAKIRIDVVEVMDSSLDVRQLRVRHGVLALTFADGLVGEVEVLDRMRGPGYGLTSRRLRRELRHAGAALRGAGVV